MLLSIRARAELQDARDTDEGTHYPIGSMQSSLLEFVALTHLTGIYDPMRDSELEPSLYKPLFREV